MQKAVLKLGYVYKKKQQRNILQNIPGTFTLIMSLPYLKNIIRRNSWVVNSHVLGIASLVQGMP